MCNEIAPLFGISLFIHFYAIISLFFCTFIIRTLTETNQHQIFYVMHRKSSSKTKTAHMHRSLVESENIWKSFVPRTEFTIQKNEMV